VLSRKTYLYRIAFGSLPPLHETERRNGFLFHRVWYETLCVTQALLNQKVFHFCEKKSSSETNFYQTSDSIENHK